MKWILSIVSGILGAFLGLLLGSMGVYYLCVWLDQLSYPEGVPPGGGLSSVGWVFWFVTIPLGTIFGGIGGFFLAFFRIKRRKP